MIVSSEFQGTIAPLPSLIELSTYFLLIEYDGTDYCGWQVQPGQPTIQAALQDAIAIALRESVQVVGSGRTDSGVHARGQIAHFKVETAIRPERLQASLNGILPPDIVVRAISGVQEGFHARYDALDRRYHYYVSTVPSALERRTRVWLRQPIDFNRMNDASASLVGTRDFDAFCLIKSETKNRVCCVKEAVWVRETEYHWYFRIVADRFLHGMVRALAGTLLQIGTGKRPADDLSRIMESRDRREAGPAAPAHGLVLEEVRYPG